MGFRLFSLPLVMLLALALAACGGAESSPDAETTSSSTFPAQTAASGEVECTVPLEPLDAA